MTKKIKIFTLPVCPKCHLLMNKMEKLGVNFEEVTMSDPEPQTELLMNDVYVIESPVLCVEGRYYDHTKIFDGDLVKKNIINLLADSPS